MHIYHIHIYRFRILVHGFQAVLLLYQPWNSMLAEVHTHMMYIPYFFGGRNENHFSSSSNLFVYHYSCSFISFISFISLFRLISFYFRCLCDSLWLHNFVFCRVELQVSLRQKFGHQRIYLSEESEPKNVIPYLHTFFLVVTPSLLSALGIEDRDTCVRRKYCRDLSRKQNVIASNEFLDEIMSWIKD